ncbi:MAG: TolC family protein, partial [Prevotella sp.]|nr:TolC family protein [Prevotella sp.]
NNNIAQQAEMTTAVTAQSIQEQITLLYFQILYAQEAIVVNKESLATSIKNEERGKEMYQVGKISRADLSQLKAQRVQDEYNIVASESSLNDYKRQLKQILEITNNEDFNIVTPPTTSQEALQDIPAVHAVYMAAIEHRPEMKLAQLAIEGSDINIKMAKSLNMPTIGLTGTVATNTHSLDDNSWGKQIKNNLYSSAGVSLNIPLFDNRNKKTALNKALIDKENNQLDLRNKQTVLYANIENYWLQATNNQNKYKAALVNVKSESESYELLSEQFRLGLKNIVELMTGKTRLITAQQNELQSKYLTILHINLLHFYQTGQLK